MKKWTALEKQALLVFIRNNPETILKTTSTPKILSSSLSADRSPEAIYHAWRRMKGLKNKPSQPILPNPQWTSGFICAFEQFVNEYVLERVAEMAGEAIKENEELKTLLRKLTKVREAVEGFKL